jgi:putative addiction module killer protein
VVRQTQCPGSGEGGDRHDADGAGKPRQYRRLGAGIHEYRIDFGPGYRVYFGKDGDSIVILLGGGTKKRQQSDIETARSLWRAYKRRKTQET